MPFSKRPYSSEDSFAIGHLSMFRFKDEIRKEALLLTNLYLSKRNEVVLQGETVDEFWGCFFK
jgi:hypothetical protein